MFGKFVDRFPLEYNPGSPKGLSMTSKPSKSSEKMDIKVSPKGDELVCLARDAIKEIGNIAQALFAVSDSLDKVAEAIQDK